MLHSEHDKIAIPIVGGFDFYRHHEIVRLEGDENHTNFFFADKTKVNSSHTLKYYELQLIGKGFMRVHQSHIININYVKRYLKGEGGIVIMEDSSQIDVSRSHKDALILELVKRWGCAGIIGKVINHSR